MHHNKTVRSHFCPASSKTRSSSFFMCTQIKQPWTYEMTCIMWQSCPLQGTVLNNFNLLTPNDDCSGRTTPLTSKRCILYIYSTNIGTEYFEHGIYSPFFPLQNAVCFINLTYLVPVLFTFYIQGVLKLKK